MNVQEHQEQIRTLSAQLRGEMVKAEEDDRAAILKLPDGLHKDVPHRVYHQRLKGLVSRTALEHARRAPSKYKAWLDGDLRDDESEALDFGIATHTAILEPALFAQTYVVEPVFGDCRKKENKAARDAWRRENAGKHSVSADDDDAIRGMVARVRAHKLANQLLAGGVSEITALWRDEATGLRCKARADYWIAERKTIVDVKTCQDARPAAFERDAAKYGYHRQCALYRDGFAACGAEVDNFVFLCIEKAAPYEIGLHVIDRESLELGREGVRETMRTLAECIRLDTFNGYPETINVVSVPRWAA